MRLARAGRAAGMFAVVMDVSPRRPPVVRIGEPTASSQTSNSLADPTPRQPSRLLLRSLLHRDVCAFNYCTAPVLTSASVNHLVQGPRELLSRPRRWALKNAMNIVNSWKIVARPRTVGRLPPGYDNFDAAVAPRVPRTYRPQVPVPV